MREESMEKMASLLGILRAARFTQVLVRRRLYPKGNLPLFEKKRRHP
jgi:hypothetical protein